MEINEAHIAEVADEDYLARYTKIRQMWCAKAIRWRFLTRSRLSINCSLSCKLARKNGVPIFPFFISPCTLINSWLIPCNGPPAAAMQGMRQKLGQRWIHSRCVGEFIPSASLELTKDRSSQTGGLARRDNAQGNQSVCKFALIRMCSRQHNSVSANASLSS